VIATAGSPTGVHAARARRDHIFDSRNLAFVDEIRRVTKGEGVDVVLNSLAGEAMARSVDCLKPFGGSWSLGSATITPTVIWPAPFGKSSYFGIDAAPASEFPSTSRHKYSPS